MPLLRFAAAERPSSHRRRALDAAAAARGGQVAGRPPGRQRDRRSRRRPHPAARRGAGGGREAGAGPGGLALGAGGRLCFDLDHASAPCHDRAALEQHRQDRGRHRGEDGDQHVDRVGGAALAAAGSASQKASAAKSRWKVSRFSSVCHIDAMPALARWRTRVTRSPRLASSSSAARGESLTSRSSGFSAAQFSAPSQPGGWRGWRSGWRAPPARCRCRRPAAPSAPPRRRGAPRARRRGRSSRSDRRSGPHAAPSLGLEPDEQRLVAGRAARGSGRRSLLEGDRRPPARRPAEGHRRKLEAPGRQRARSRPPRSHSMSRSTPASRGTSSARTPAKAPIPRRPEYLPAPARMAPLTTLAAVSP